LDTLVAFDEVNETSHVQLVVLLPELIGLGRIVLIFLLNDFEEHDFAGRSGDKSFVVDEVHLSKILISHLFKFGFLSVITGDNKGFTLSVE